MLTWIIENSQMANLSMHVAVKVQFVEDQSNPDNRQFTFAYTITIRNDGLVSTQLIGRHWLITDGEGHVQEVRGLGVVGQQPLLKPGEQFEYTSWATLPTPVGTMKGEYFCMSDQAEYFEAPIAEFALAMPRTLH
jgi:ApaG protein